MNKIDVKDLQAGDILLYHPGDAIGWAISVLTLSPVCHAGLYMGDGQVAEEIGKGLVEDSVSESFGHRKIYVKRLRNPKDMTPVTDIAQGYIDHDEKYGYADIILIATGILSADIEKLANIFRWDKTSGFFDKLGHIAENLTYFLKLMYDTIKHSPMICSQFVYTCYDEAGYKLTDQN